MVLAPDQGQIPPSQALHESSLGFNLPPKHAKAVGSDPARSTTNFERVPLSAIDRCSSCGPATIFVRVPSALPVRAKAGVCRHGICCGQVRIRRGLNPLGFKTRLARSEELLPSQDLVAKNLLEYKVVVLWAICDNRFGVNNLLLIMPSFLLQDLSL